MAKKKKNKDSNATTTGPRTVATNRKARHDYHIEEIYEAGISLMGTEIKSLRMGRVSLQDGFVLIRDGQAMLMNIHIAHYAQGNRNNHEEVRPRKLLLHRRQIDNLHTQVTQRSWTIIPLRVYINAKGLAKIEVGLARGKRAYDKRETISKRETDRDLQRAVKHAAY